MSQKKTKFKLGDRIIYDGCTGIVIALPTNGREEIIISFEENDRTWGFSVLQENRLFKRFHCIPGIKGYKSKWYTNTSNVTLLQEEKEIKKQNRIKLGI